MQTRAFLSGSLALSIAFFGCAAPEAEEEVASVSEEQPLIGGAFCSVLGNCRASRIEDWKTSAASAHDLDTTKLDAATRFAADNDARCLLVVRDGELVYEQYRNGADARSLHDTYSIAKTFTSALVGIAIAKGQIKSPDDLASTYIPEWKRDSHAAIQVKHLLGGVSGIRYWPSLGMSVDLGDYSWLYTHHDLNHSAVHHPADEAPGRTWRYNNHAVQAVGQVLEGATGENVDDYARKNLWGPIGMTVDGNRTSGTHWRRDHAGNAVAFSSVFATCRGLAKFGQLLLQRGAWNGTQLLDRAYVDRMLSPSQDKNRAYGYLTWLNQGPAIGNTHNTFDGVPFPEAPADLVSAQGVGQNFVDVIPSTRTVIVHIRPPRFLNVQEILGDGKQEIHRAVLARVLAADKRR